MLLFGATPFLSTSVTNLDCFASAITARSPPYTSVTPEGGLPVGNTLIGVDRLSTKTKKNALFIYGSQIRNLDSLTPLLSYFFVRQSRLFCVHYQNAESKHTFPLLKEGFIFHNLFVCLDRLTDLSTSSFLINEFEFIPWDLFFRSS